MRRFIRGVCLITLLAAAITELGQTQKALSWDEAKARFETNNPTLRAALNYLNLIGSYLIAAGQLNLAVGREVLQ